MPDWYNDHDELVAFGRQLAGPYDWTALDAFYYMEKPYKYEREHQLWVEYDRPDAGDPGWDGWADALINLESSENP